MNDALPADPQQRQVADLLAAQSAALTMPADVAARVHDALADEAAARAGRVVQVAHQPPTATVATPARTSRWLVAASVAAAAVLGPTVLVTVLSQGGDDVATVGPPAQESLQRDDAAAADAGQGSQEPDAAASEGGEELAPGSSGLTEVPVDVLEVLDDPAADPAPPGCGSRLADEIGGQTLWAVGYDGDTVLVVVEERDGLAVWWLASCGSGVSQALGRSGAG